MMSSEEDASSSLGEAPEERDSEAWEAGES